MGAVRLIYDETLRQMKKVGWIGELSVKETRRIAAGHLRYCLQGNTMYLPEDESLIEAKHRLCWGRIRVEEFDDLPWLAEFDRELPEDPLAYHRPFMGIGFGVMYSRRHRETEDGRVRVSTFVAQSVIDAIAENGDALLGLSKSDFEALTAELFARMGFDVDLFRGSKDDGIDFLAVRNDDTPEPIVIAVQSKHPDVKSTGAKRNVLPVATIREIFGVAKAWNIHGAIAITSSTYSPDAKRFVDLCPDEMAVHNAADVIEWVRRYRWNQDE